MFLVDGVGLYKNQIVNHGLSLFVMYLHYVVHCGLDFDAQLFEQLELLIGEEDISLSLPCTI
jgi:hypothetical protein